MRRKQPHDLHECTNVTELCERLGQRGVDLFAFPHEMIKPGYECGVVIGGSIANGIGTPLSDVDVVILLSDPNGVKRSKRDICGCLIRPLPATLEHEFAASMIMNGIEIDVQIVADPRASPQASEAPGQPNNELHSIDGYAKTRFLSKLSSDWILQGREIVEQYRRLFQVHHFALKRTVADFVAAAKDLEDVKQAVGTLDGRAGVIGFGVVSAAMRSLLVHRGYRGQASKWIRAAILLAARDPEFKRILDDARALLFRSAPTSLHAEQEYADGVAALCAAVKSVLYRQDDLRAAIQSIEHDLDLYA